MKLGNERTDTPLLSAMDPGLAALLIRLEDLAMGPEFRVQRQVALMRYLQPYASVGVAEVLGPLPEELRLADLFIYGDLFPEDGQPTLVEQVRDTVSSHVSNEERAWLDSVRHSYLDLLEIRAREAGRPNGILLLRSLGDGQEFRVSGGEWSRGRIEGQILLTRLIRRAGEAVVPDVALAMSRTVGLAVFESANQTRRQMEASQGTFALGDWQEFAKQYGYILAWKVAEVRLKLLLLADVRTRFCRPDGQPLLYAVAIYEHHEPRVLAEGLSRLEGWQSEPIELPGNGTDRQQAKAWVRTARFPDRSGSEAQAVTARIILTPTQLIVECDQDETLNAVKHQLAATFGFSLHFRGETTEVPRHDYPEVDLLKEDVPLRLVAIPQDEELRLLRGLLESMYLDWADRPNTALGGDTPRQVARHGEQRSKLEALIKDLEREDLAFRRTGQRGYDYDRLRAHLGLA
jgi:hypothetical protein